MAKLSRITHAPSVLQMSTDKVFVEKATIVGTGISTLTLYDGTGTDGRIIAELGCVANGFESDDNINESCPDGLYAVITTGAGLAKAIVYSR